MYYYLSSFQAYAFDLNNLKGVYCEKMSDASKDDFDPDFWYDYKCEFDSSVTVDSLYNDV